MLKNINNMIEFDTNNGTLLYHYIRGSHAYGLNVETSDIDSGGVFCATQDDIIGTRFKYKDQISDAKSDNVFYELEKYISLLGNSNPNILESLFIPDNCVLYEHPAFSIIKENRDKLITKKCFNKFFGFASTQIAKARGLNKKIVNPITERKGPLDFVYTFYKQGSTKIENWLDHRGMYQKYCGLVNIPNMNNIMGVYYDWGNHFIHEHITCKDLYNGWLLTNVNTLTDLIHRFKSGELSDNELEQFSPKYKQAQLGNMARFICDFYGVKFHTITKRFEDWFNKQIPIGYSGMVGEDKLSNELRLSSVSKGEMPVCYINYNKDGYSQHCREYKEYKDWEKNRNPVRYESNLDKNYDSKNMMHSFRLMQMCIEIAQDKGFNCDRRNIDREFLLNIRNHKYEYDELIAMLDKKKDEMNEAIKNSDLPDDIDPNFLNELCIKIRKEIYK